MRTDAPSSEMLRLAAWLSPAFPIGAFAYSGGLEWAVEAGLVGGRAELEGWLSHQLGHGIPRQEAVLLARSWRAAADPDALLETARLARALKGTAELAQETVVQGAAFLRTVRSAWPDPVLDRLTARFQAEGIEPALPVAVGVAASTHGIALGATLVLYLHAWAANQVSAAIRLSVIGQTDGQKVTAALEPAILRVAGEAQEADPDDLGTAAAMVDWCSMRHETQFSRLFRS